MKTSKKGESEVHLIFRIGNNYFGLPVSKATNIIEISRMNSTKKQDNFIIGNVSLRGTSVPVVTLHSKFGKKLENYTYNNSILMLETNSSEKFHIGIIIDDLIDSMEIKQKDISEGAGKENLTADSITGYYIRNKNMQINILEPESIFTNEEILKLKNAQNI